MRRGRMAMAVMFGMAMMAAAAAGCRTQTCVVANTDTLVGIQATYQPDLNLPTGKVGYARHELVLVPTNRVSDKTPKAAMGEGAKDCANVLTEFNFCNFFSFWRSNGLYQRIAVGDLAVTQPGAAVMFAKDESGQISEAAADAIKALVTNDASGDDAARTSLKTELLKLCRNENVRKFVMEYLESRGITWDRFIDDTVKMTLDEIRQMVEKARTM